MFRIQHLEARTAKMSKFIEEIASKQKKKSVVIGRRQALRLLEKLQDATPADTGAAANDASRARRGLYPKHPAFIKGLHIGMSSDGEGGSGWQIREDIETTRYTSKWVIFNPMWRPYLRFFEYGMAESREFGNIAGFVKRIWYEFKEEMSKKGSR